MITLIITYALLGLVYGLWPGIILVSRSTVVCGESKFQRILIPFLLWLLWPIYVFACTIVISILITNTNRKHDGEDSDIDDPLSRLR